MKYLTVYTTVSNAPFVISRGGVYLTSYQEHTKRRTRHLHDVREASACLDPSF